MTSVIRTLTQFGMHILQTFVFFITYYHLFLIAIYFTVTSRVVENMT